MKITFWKCLLDTIGLLDEIDWESFAVRMTTKRTFEGLDKHPGWSAAEFRNNKRNRENVVGVHAIVLDFDETLTISEARNLWAGYRGLLQTTKSHMQDRHSFRVVLTLSRPVSAFEFDGLWLRAQLHCGGTADKQAKDPSRFWYQPGTMNGGDWHGEIWAGEDLDPDAWLTKPLPETPKPVIERQQTQSDIEERAIKYIARMDPAISGSGGHDTAFQVALALVKGFALPEDDAFAIMWGHYNQRCQPPWEEKEIRHKVKSAAAAAHVPAGYIVDRQDESRTYRTSANVAPKSKPFYEPSQDPDVPEVDAAKPEKSPSQCLGVKSIAVLCSEVLTLANAGKPEFGCPIGIGTIDDAMAGMRRGMITVLGAQTSWGKTGCAVMASEESIKVGKRVLFLPFEDSSLLYGRRIIARRGRISALRLRNCVHNISEIKSITKVTAYAECWPFLLNCIGKSAEWAAKAIRFLAKEISYDLIVVDYLQRIRVTKQTQDRRNEVTAAMAVLGDAVKEVNAAGLFLSQLKRIEGRPPSMEDLKESGDIENMAEHIILGEKMKRDRSIKFDRRAYLAKNKDGPLLDEPEDMIFDETTASFTMTTTDDQGAKEFTGDDEIFPYADN